MLTTGTVYILEVLVAGTGNELLSLLTLLSLMLLALSLTLLTLLEISLMLLTLMQSLTLTTPVLALPQQQCSLLETHTTLAMLAWSMPEMLTTGNFALGVCQQQHSGVFIAGEGRFTWDLSSKFLRNFSENCVE
jgi:hypothetical protein